MSETNGVLKPICLNESEQQIREDYEWALRDPGVQREFAGKVVIVHQHRILGAGNDYRAAMADAERKPDCPAISELAKVFVEGYPLVDSPE